MNRTNLKILIVFFVLAAVALVVLGAISDHMDGNDFIYPPNGDRAGPYSVLYWVALLPAGIAFCLAIIAIITAPPNK